jgi:hypothetical protein
MLMLFVWAVVSLASARLTLSAFVGLHDRHTLWKHYKKPASLDSRVSRDDEA